MIKRLLHMGLFLTITTVAFAAPDNSGTPMANVNVANASAPNDATAPAQNASLATPIPPPPAQVATTNTDAMVVKVSVPNESTAALQDALPQAFSQVLINVTGDPGVMQEPAVQNQRPNLSSFVQNYTFVRENGPQGSQAVFAQITFDKTAVDQFLQQTGLHIISSQAVRMEISGIASLQDYLGAVKAIKMSPEIKHVLVTDTNGTSVIISMEVNGGAKNLARILSQNQNFVQASPDSQAGSVDVYYRWQRPA